MGHRAIWHKGWRAVTVHDEGQPYDSDSWRLYNTSVDFAEVEDLAEQRPEVLRTLKDLWWREADAHDVLPLDDRPLRTLITLARPVGLAAQAVVTMRPGQSHLPRATGLAGSNRAIDVSVRLTTDAESATGTMLSSGNAQGGYFFGLDDGRPVFEHKLLATRVTIASYRRLSACEHRIGFRIRPSIDRSAFVELLIADEIVGTDVIPVTSSHPSFWGLDVCVSRVGGFHPLQTLALPTALVSSVTLTSPTSVKDLVEHAEELLVSE